MPDVIPGQPRNGRVVTFYSFKGGTGVTMALANIAWILASNGYRVLAADWDLESPGLHRYFAPFLDSAVHDAQGIIDMIRDYEWYAKKVRQAEADGNPEPEEVLRANIGRHAEVQRFTIPIRDWEFPGGGSLEFLSPGRQNKDYLATISALDWDSFYNELDGGVFLNAFREELKAHYDYALIDGRTGLSDLADVCTVHLPDILVDCFTLATQGVDGAAQVARDVNDLFGDRIRVLPVPMRVDPSEQARAEAGRIYARRKFDGLPADLSAAERQVYWANVEVPYRSYYSYEETLAVFGDEPGVPGSMLAAYERITGYVTDGATTRLPVIDENVRNEARARFERRAPRERRGCSPSLS
jgi:cellulose biosynthesis protein BcsQ